MQPQVLQSQTFIINTNETSDNANVSGADFQNIALTVSGTDGADFSFRVKGSIQKEVPDFSSAASSSNQWSYIQIKNDMTNAYLNGDTGYTMATDETVTFELNTSVLTWVAVEVFNHAGGVFNGFFTFKNNI